MSAAYTLGWVKTYLKSELTKLFFCLQELFVEMIAKDALVYAQQGKRKTLQRKDLGKLKG